MPVIRKGNSWVATGGDFICDLCKFHSRHVLGMGCRCNDRNDGSNHADKQCRFFQEGESFHCLQCGKVRQYERDPELTMKIWGGKVPRRCKDRNWKSFNSCKENTEEGDQK